METSEAIETVAKDGMSVDKRQWRDLSAFDALDESWSAPAPSYPKDEDEHRSFAHDIGQVKYEEENEEENAFNQESFKQQERRNSDGVLPLAKLDPVASSSSTIKLSPLRSSRRANAVFSKTIGADLDWHHRQALSNSKDDTARRRKKGKLRRRSSGAMTDSELLQPGPSSPSLRIPSHKLPSNRGIQMLLEQGTDDQKASNRASSEPSSPSLSASLAFHDPLSPTRTARSSSTSSSGQKQGIDLSLQHLNLGPPLQSQRVVALRAANSHPEQNSLQNESLFGPDQFGSAREDVSASQGAVTAEEATFIEHSNIASPPAFLKPAWAKKDQKGKTRDMFAPLPLQTMFEPPSDTSRLAWQKADGEDPPKSLQDAHEVKDVSLNSPGKDKDEEDEGQQDNINPISPASHSEADETRETGERPNDVAAPTNIPQCTFTFSSPVVQPKRPPPTPSTSHAPLRLFHLKGRNNEIEQILNTPRSAAKSRDAKKMIWKLVEEEGRGERESKRLRMDRIPNVADLPEAKVSEKGDAPVDYVLEAPSLMDRIRAAGNREVVNNRTISSSLVVDRKGANAPTPERARHHRRFGQTNSPFRRGESPRKLLRRWSAANQVDEELEEKEKNGNLSASDEAWQDVAYEDGPVNFQTSSSSITPMTRIPSVSIEPPASPDADVKEEDVRSLPKNLASLGRSTDRPGMLHISPDAVPMQEIEAMSNGRMTFDRKMNRWISTRHLQRRDPNGKRSEIPEDSTDPFHDFESLNSPAQNPPIFQAEKMSLSGSKSSVQSSSNHDSLAPPLRSTTQSVNSSHAFLTPARNTKSNPNRSVTPKSILKIAGNSARWPSDQGTPTMSRQANRKISFADGIEPSGSIKMPYESEKAGVHDIRRRPSELLGDVSEEDEEEFAEGLPFGGRRSSDTSARFTTPEAGRSASFAAANMSARSPWSLSMLRGSNRRSLMGNGGISFSATNASFNIAHDNMLALLTDIAPFELPWHNIRTIDLRGRRVDSLVRIDEFLPRLEEALLDDNQIEYLTGLPNTMRYLSIARNRLPSTAAFGHLENMETLDVSDNNIDLRALRNLHQLKHLRANGNRITSIQGIQNLQKLETLHLRNNSLDELDIQTDQWPNLQDLVLSRNRLRQIHGLDNLVRLRSLNLDHNHLQELDLGAQMPRLKQLRVSGNENLSSLDVRPAHNLRTLYADECSLNEVTNIGSLTKLDNLSLRQQNGDGELQWPAHDIRDVKRLFLSGNAFRAIDIANSYAAPSRLLHLSSSNRITQFFGLVYLELSGCQLTSLPEDLAKMVPNLRQLNADYNLLDSLPQMNKMSRLKRLSLVGCRIDRSRKLIECLEGCEELNLLDVRMNPCTLGLYPPIVMAAPRGTKFNRAYLPPIPHPFFSSSQEGPNANSEKLDDHNENMNSFAEKSFFHKRHPPPPMMMMGEESKAQIRALKEDDKDDEPDTLFAASDLRFARTLPPHFKLERLLHRGMLAMACANLTWLDGLLIDEDEVVQADEYLRRNNVGRQQEDLRFEFDGEDRKRGMRERSDSIFSSNSE